MARWHVLACDIGGTNSRFGHFTLDGSSPATAVLRLAACRQCATATLPDMAAAQAAAMACFADTTLQPDAQVWAVAGPLTLAQADDAACPSVAVRACLSNAPLCVDVTALLAAGRPVALLNDFAAQAWACVSAVGRQARPICTGAADDGATAEAGATDKARAPLGVIGAGTGLGMASLVPVAGGDWLAVSSEGGHVPFAFAQDEAPYALFLRTQYHLDMPSAEQVLCGDGLERLHQYVTGERLPAADIAARFLGTATAAQGAHTARLFARFYGRMCRHWILTTCCTGGLYVSGGVAARNPSLLQYSDFIQELHHPSAPAWVRAVPVWLLDNPLSGLWGAARAAQAVCAAAVRPSAG